MKKETKKVTFKEIVKGSEDKSDWTINIYPLSYPSHIISWFIARFFPFITPNQISFFWEFLALIGIFIMSLGNYWNLLTGILIYQLAILFDYVDGQIARTTKKTTIGGTYLDFVFSWINRSLLMLALGIGLYRSSEEIIYFYFGLSTCLFLLFDNLAKLKVYETLFSKDMYDIIIKQRDKLRKSGRRVQQANFIQKTKAFLVEMMRPFSPFSFLFFSILFNISEYYLIIMAILVPILFIKNFITIYKDIRHIRT